MKLTVDNFFSDLIFHPWDADSRKDQAKAWVSTLALGILSFGICHAICAIRRCIKHKPHDQSSSQDKKVSNIKDSVIKPEKKIIQVNIAPEIKKTLDTLFEGSPYSIDALPIYPIVQDTFNRNEMSAPVMKGITENGRPFIVIKVDCDLKDEDIEKIESSKIQNIYRAKRQLKAVLVLYQYHKDGPLSDGEGKFMWDQLGRGKLLQPDFFSWNFTYAEDGSGPTDSQIENFKLVQTLLKTGSSQDNKGLTWNIPKE